jgi:hypothetical protein
VPNASVHKKDDASALSTFTTVESDQFPILHPVNAHAAIVSREGESEPRSSSSLTHITVGRGCIRIGVRRHTNGGKI